MKKDGRWYIEVIATSRDKWCAAVWEDCKRVFLAAQDIVLPGDLICFLLKLIAKHGCPGAIETDQGEICRSINGWASAHGILVIVKSAYEPNLKSAYEAERRRHSPLPPDRRFVSGASAETIFSYLQRLKARSLGN